MKRRELFRRTVLGTTGAAITSLLPTKANEHIHPPRQIPADYDASKELARPDWKPAFLDEHQNETLILLSDLIIPATDTPGAKSALVNRFIDRLLSGETSDTKRAFLARLAYLDGECRERYDAAFIHVPPERQMEFLKLIAYPHNLVTWGDNKSEFEGHLHFRLLKRWISQAYYNSEIGMKELGWKGNPFHEDFPGCTHPAGSHR